MQHGDKDYTEQSLTVPQFQPKRLSSASANVNPFPPAVTVETTEDVAIAIDEHLPLINKDQVITIDSGVSLLGLQYMYHLAISFHQFYIMMNHLI